MTGDLTSEEIASTNAWTIRAIGIEQRFDLKAERARQAGKDGLANRLEAKGNRIDTRLDRKGDQIESRLDRRGEHGSQDRRRGQATNPDQKRRDGALRYRWQPPREQAKENARLGGDQPRGNVRKN